MSSPWTPPVPLTSASDKSSFAYESTVKRWPAILTQVIDGLYSASYTLGASDASDEAKRIIERIAALKHDMGRDRPLQPINAQDPDTSLFDKTIAHNNWSWFSAPWLFAECYLYRLLRSFFATSQHWANYDPFAHSKNAAFRQSGTAITALAETIEGIVAKANASGTEQGQGQGQGPESTPEGRAILFHEMAQMSLWGNATDLSLLTSLSYADLQALQTTGREQQEARAKFILANDLDRAWAHLSAQKEARVDIVLDNAGFELVSDLIFADWLLTTPHVSHVVFHPKNMPWFVSDVIPTDFAYAIRALRDADFFERNRSLSRTRDLQADPAAYTPGAGATPAPVGSRQLKMSDAGERGRSPHPPGSRHLQAREGSIDARLAAPAPAGSRNFQMDPSYLRDSSLSPTRARGRSTGVKPPLSPIQSMAARWMSHIESGRFLVATNTGFWTLPAAFANMHVYAPDLLAELRQHSALVIFKGDLNYRKLTSDAVWPSTTPFAHALGPLAGQFDILALRTNKADVCVGLADGVEQEVQSKDPNWRINGKWAVVQFAPRS